MLSHLNKYNIILGSGSPRRQELLKTLGFHFTVLKGDADETIPHGMLPQDAPVYLAQLKANELKPRIDPNDVLITADTIVILEGRILGKPLDKQDAVQMLIDMGGRSHEVISGLCITHGDTQSTLSDKAVVNFAPISQEEAEWYVDHYEVLDKAGAYGVQDWIGQCKVIKIEGSHFNIMGLPVHLLYDFLKELKLDL